MIPGNPGKFCAANGPGRLSATESTACLATLCSESGTVSKPLKGVALGAPNNPELLLALLLAEVARLLETALLVLLLRLDPVLNDADEDDFTEARLDEIDLADEVLLETFTKLDKLELFEADTVLEEPGWIELLRAEFAFDDTMLDFALPDPPPPDPPHAERMTSKELTIIWLHRIFMGITHAERFPRSNPKKLDETWQNLTGQTNDHFCDEYQQPKQKWTMRILGFSHSSPLESKPIQYFR